MQSFEFYQPINLSVLEDSPKFYQAMNLLGGVGPYDGGCLVIAKALVKTHGGKLVRLVSDMNDAEHYGALIGDKIYDYDGHYNSSNEWFTAVKSHTHMPGRTKFSVEYGEVPSEIPDNPDAVSLICTALAGLEINESVLVEGASSILYHYCNLRTADDILISGKFKLASTTGQDVEAKLSPEGYTYFLSTTRTLTGDYHRHIGSAAVMFNLDGNKISQRYKVGPVDYWERMWNHPGSTRTRESEDRVFSKTNTIPVNVVTAVHVYLKHHDESYSSAARRVLIDAKKRGVPAFLYDDETAWRLQNTGKAVSVASQPLLKGTEPSQRTFRNDDHLKRWLSLISAQSTSNLDADAKTLLNRVMRSKYYPTDDLGLTQDMANGRKPTSDMYDSVVKMNSLMKQNNWKSTIDIKNFVINKWEAIQKREQNEN